jgi:hypothetical protein
MRKFKVREVELYNMILRDKVVAQLAAQALGYTGFHKSSGRNTNEGLLESYSSRLILGRKKRRAGFVSY